MEQQEQVLHKRKLLHVQGGYGGIQNALGIQVYEIWASPVHASQSFNIFTALFLTCISVL